MYYLKPFWVVLILLNFNNLEAQAQKPEETQIKNVLEDAAHAFLKESLTAVAQKYWIIDSSTVRSISFLDGSTYQLRGSDLEYADEIPPEGHAELRRYNYKIYINGDFAFVTNDQEVTLASNANKQFTHELWVLEKVSGNWKIHVQTVHHFNP